MSKRVQVIINPTAGQDQPILGVLNRVFHDAGTGWDVSITNTAGDARRFARQPLRPASMWWRPMAAMAP